MKTRRILNFFLCVLLFASGVALADGHVNGTWELTVTLADGQGGAALFKFEQDGEKLNGEYNGVLGEAKITGSVKGDELEFSFETEAGKITYKGKISGKTIEGTCEYGSLGAGTFKGEKQE